MLAIFSDSELMKMLKNLQEFLSSTIIANAIFPVVCCRVAEYNITQMIVMFYVVVDRSFMLLLQLTSNTWLNFDSHRSE